MGLILYQFLCLCLFQAFVRLEPTIHSILPYMNLLSPKSFTNLSQVISSVSFHNLPKLNGECGTALAEMILSPGTSSYLSNFILYSGRKIQDLGNYPACKNTTNSYYVLAGINITYIVVKMGLCLPKACTSVELSIYRPYLASLLKSASGMDVDPETIAFVDVEAYRHQYDPTGSIGYIFSYLFLGIMLLIIVIATIVDQLQIYSPEEIEKRTSIKALCCFSASKNLKSFFNTTNRVDPNLEIYSGLRVLAMAWVIIGHTHENEGWLASTLNFPALIKIIKESFLLSILKQGSLSVDTFFFIAGFFAAASFYSALKIPKLRTLKTVLLFYLNRYLRLFPIMLFTFLFITFVMITLRDTLPHTYLPLTMDNCKKYWQWLFLYVNNFQGQQDACIDYSWYLMNDMQFFLFTPLIIIPFCHSYLYGFLTITGFSSVSIVVSAVLIQYYKIHTALSKPNSMYDYFDIYYVRPYCRYIPYLQGILFYFLYYEQKKKKKSHPANSS